MTLLVSTPVVNLNAVFDDSPLTVPEQEMLLEQFLCEGHSLKQPIPFIMKVACWAPESHPNYRVTLEAYLAANLDLKVGDSVMFTVDTDYQSPVVEHSRIFDFNEFVARHKLSTKHIQALHTEFAEDNNGGAYWSLGLEMDETNRSDFSEHWQVLSGILMDKYGMQVGDTAVFSAY